MQRSSRQTASLQLGMPPLVVCWHTFISNSFFARSLLSPLFFIKWTRHKFRNGLQRYPRRNREKKIQSKRKGSTDWRFFILSGVCVCVLLWNVLDSRWPVKLNFYTLQRFIKALVLSFETWKKNLIRLTWRPARLLFLLFWHYKKTRIF